MTHLDLEENQLFTKLDLDRTIFKISLLYMAFSVSHQKVLNFYCQNSSLLLIVAKKMEFSFWLTKFWSIQSCPLCIWKNMQKMNLCKPTARNVSSQERFLVKGALPQTFCARIQKLSKSFCEMLLKLHFKLELDPRIHSKRALFFKNQGIFFYF